SMSTTSLHLCFLPSSHSPHPDLHSFPTRRSSDLFSMALAFQLANAGFPPEELRTRADLTMEKEEIGWTIKAIALHLEARVPGIEPARFEELAQKAKAGCPVSRLLNADITLDATLA